MKHDETWFYQYDSEKKHQIFQRKWPEFPKPKQGRIPTSKAKIMLIYFFNMEQIIHYDFAIPKRQSIKQFTFKFWKVSADY
jgi:hypothetical protein